MTKARDLADIIAGGFTADDIPNLDTAKVTTGTFADARISASSVSQHATTYDDNKLQSNVALLGFKTAVNGSLAKYNLQDQIIDEYTDATGVDASASTNEFLTGGGYVGEVVVTPTVTGGSTAVDGDYTVHTISATGSTNFVTDTALTVDYLIVGGGGAGGTGNGGGGGGGAGGLISQTSQSLAIGTFAAVVGTGGAGQSTNTAGGHGTDSSFNSHIGGGGAGGPGNDSAGIAGDTANGGSGSGATGIYAIGGAAGSQGATNAGGVGQVNDGGGGGGAGGIGGDPVLNNVGGAGGVGLSNSITGSAVFYAGGGGGNTEAGSTASLGGNGGGGNGSAQGSATQALVGVDGKGGGGGGGDYNDSLPSKDGGSGVVIIRRLTNLVSGGGNLTLQSNDTTASTANPDYADMVVLMENVSGTTTLNTDIKGYISEDSGVTFTQGTLVDEGTWGTNKKIIAFHDLDISAQTGSAMCYKITTHNQSAGVKETKVHATSIGWR